MERKQIQIKFQNKTFFLYLENFDNLIQLQNEIKLRFKLDPKDYYITTRNKLINKDWDFKNSLTNYYEIHPKIKGGFGFGALISGILKIIQMASRIPDVFMWLVDMVMWFVTQVLNPVLFFQDVGKSIVVILKLFVFTILDAITGIFKLLIDTVFNPILSGFWGYVPKDDLITDEDVEKKGKKSKDNFANVTNSTNTKTNSKCNKTRCIEPPATNIPIPVVLATILLPPLGVFMELGLKGWFNILLTALLTMMYYFPGLIYALIVLYC
jgi:uncharacterized membrane protein YqaE (UPF0057 family)